MLFGLTATGAEGEPARVTSIVVEHQLIIRVPVDPRPVRPVFEWVEKDGPKCIDYDRIRGALLSGSDHVDFVMDRHHRIRAKLGSNCPGLDFYGGFYLNPEDGRICAGRAVIHSRMGGSCPIDAFNLLVPRPRE